jgi:hypothetical protein
VIEQAVQGDETAVAPADEPDPVLVDARVVLDDPVAGRQTVADLAAAVVDRPVHAPAVARRAAVLRCHDDVALSDQLTDDTRVVGREVGVHAAVRQHQQRQLAAAEVLTRREDVGVELERVARAARRRVRLVGQRRSVDPDLLDDGQVADALEPEHVVDHLLEHIQPVVQVVVGPH